MADYRRLQVIFEEVFDIPEPERSRAVRRLAAGDDQVAAEVSSLLHEMDHLAGSPFLAEPLLSDQLFLADAARRPTGPKPVIGGYQISHVLGSGSSGTVYRARSTGTLTRDVAIKVLRAGLPPSAVASFHREQRLLASLNHPGVAQVYDAGETADGLDYVVVEYIDGPSITRYAAEYELSWRDRVELIIRACEAVQHIHATGVLHRDIKPANILVSHDHGTPQPKVIDFGAATFAQADALLATQHPRFIGTIAYMAPEQLNSRDRADARCDVYSLGLVLHELLSGGHPFQTDAIGLGELVRRIGAGQLPELPRTLGPDRGELTAVIHKACANRPEARYPSVQHLADDLHRILQRQPIQARPPSPLFRFRALISRRPYAAVASGIAILVLAGLSVGLVDVSHRNAQQREQMQLTLAYLVDDILTELGELDGAHDLRANLAGILLERLESMEPDERSEDLHRLRARVLDSLSDLAVARGNLLQARAMREEVLGIVQHLATDGGDPQPLILARIKLGDVANSLGDQVQAHQLYLTVHETLEQRLIDQPNDERLLDELSWSYERLIPFLLETDLDGAHDLAVQRLRIASDLAARHPENVLHQFDLACAKRWVAHTTWRRGDATEALTHAADAVALHDAVIASHPNRFWFRSRQIIAHIQQYDILDSLDDPRAPAAGERAAELARAYCTANPQSSHSRELLDSILDRLEGTAEANEQPPSSAAPGGGAPADVE